MQQLDVSPGRRPPAIKIETAWSDPISEWTVCRTRAAITAHEDGQISASAALSDALERDPIIAGDLNTRCRALASRSALPFAVERGGGDGRRAEFARKRCERLWWDVCTEDTIFAIQKDAIKLGVAVGFLRWRRYVHEWIPRLEPLSPYGLDWREDEQRWYYTPRNGTPLPVTPGDGTWFLFEPFGPRSWMGGAIRSIAEPWLIRRFASRDWARFSERNGMPVLAMYEPAMALDDIEGTGGADGAGTAAFYRGVGAKMGKDAVLRLPQGRSKEEVGWDAKWLELTSTGHTGFSALLAAMEREIHHALLGHDSSSTSRGGDGEIANQRKGSEYLASDAELLSSALRRQVWMPDVAYNIDPSDLELAAWGRWDTRPPPDQSARASTLKTAAEAMGLLMKMGVDCASVAAEFGIAAPTKAPPEPHPAAPSDSNEEKNDDGEEASGDATAA